MSDINKRIAVEVMKFPDLLDLRLQTFHPDTNMNDAMMVVDKLREDGWVMHLTVDSKPSEIHLTNICEFEGERGNHVEYADTAPMAICLAALKVKEGEG